MSEGNLIVPARDKSCLGNSISTIVFGQSRGLACKGTVSEITDYPQRKFSVSSRNGTGSARSDLYLRSVKSSNLKFWRKRFSRQHPISLPCLLSEFRQNKNKSQSHYCSVSPITLIYTCTYWISSKCF